MIFRLLALPRGAKRLIAMLFDAGLCVWSFWAALYLRLGVWVPIEGNFWIGLGIATGLAIMIFEFAGLYRSVFRLSGGTIDLTLLHACLAYGAIYSFIFAFVGIVGVPRTVGIIQPILLFLSIAASRAAIFALLSRRHKPWEGAGASQRVLIYGAGNTGRHLVQALRRDRSAVPVCLIDDDASLQNARVSGLVVYAPERIRELITLLDVDKVLLALPATARRRCREIVHDLSGSNVEIQTLPGVSDMVRGDIQITDMRPLTISDLLGRPSVTPDPALLQRDVVGATVLVTGGGGSIGSELARQIHAAGPARIILVENSEYALYKIHQQLGTNTGVETVPILASVDDELRIEAILRRYRPDTIYHAAAYKHVPLVEHNCLEGIRNNVFGTDTMARLAVAYRVKAFVLISTDKAVRPTNVMGASKRLAEQIVQARASLDEGTRFSVVRFGNVLGSSGSVVPLFLDQISRGGPLTVTHRDVTRYFMTIQEAAQLVLQAGAMGSAGEVFVLDMGEEVKVYELAINMIELSGMSHKSVSNPNGEIEIKIVGLRPGEKLYEELLIGNDPQPTQHSRIMQAHEGFVEFSLLQSELALLRSAIALNDLSSALMALRRNVPEYAPDGKIVDYLYYKADF